MYLNRSIYLPNYLSIYPSIVPFICLCICLSSLSISLSHSSLALSLSLSLYTIVDVPHIHVHFLCLYRPRKHVIARGSFLKSNNLPGFFIRFPSSFRLVQGARSFRRDNVSLLWACCLLPTIPKSVIMYVAATAGQNFRHKVLHHH